MCKHNQAGTLGPIDNDTLQLSEVGRKQVFDNDWTRFVTCLQGEDCTCQMVHPANSFGVVDYTHGYNPKCASFETLAHTEKGTVIFLSEFETSKI